MSGNRYRLALALLSSRYQLYLGQCIVCGLLSPITQIISSKLDYELNDSKNSPIHTSQINPHQNNCFTNLHFYNKNGILFPDVIDENYQRQHNPTTKMLHAIIYHTLLLIYTSNTIAKPTSWKNRNFIMRPILRPINTILLFRIID